jgi:hypothetical protein
MPSEIHVEDIGTEFIATMYDETQGIVDVSLATVLQFNFKKPSGTIVTNTAGVVPDGSGGNIKYVTVEDDLDSAGPWQVQGYIEIGAGKWSTDVHRFRVYANVGP